MSSLEVNMKPPKRRHRDRTSHQIRVALAESGTPVVGDKMHGATMNLHGRICLHAVALEFLHPDTDDPVRFESEFNPAWRHGLKNP